MVVALSDLLKASSYVSVSCFNPSYPVVSNNPNYYWYHLVNDRALVLGAIWGNVMRRANKRPLVTSALIAVLGYPCSGRRPTDVVWRNALLSSRRVTDGCFVLLLVSE